MENNAHYPGPDLDDLDPDHEFPGWCTSCLDDGKEGGCPKCGLWPWPEDKEIDGITYRFIGNTDRDNECHLKYQQLQETGVQIFFEEEAIDRFHQPLPECVAIWCAVEDLNLLPRP